MQVRWEYLTPPEFKKLAKEETLCILPIGSLERHGEHLPFGTDGLTAHAIACRAAAIEPCVVFPPYWFGQVHEASCFAGTVNFPTRLLLELLETLLDQIAQNCFTKILILNGHGGNTNFLQYFAMSQVDRRVDYTLYISNGFCEPCLDEVRDLFETDGGHADEFETSVMLAVAPDAVKMKQQTFSEPIEPKVDLSHLRGAHTGLWWYAMYPEQVTGCPSLATREKGEKVLEAAEKDIVALIAAIKADTVVPALQKEFYERHGKVKDCE